MINYQISQLALADFKQLPPDIAKKIIARLQAEFFANAMCKAWHCDGHTRHSINK
ncbi:hypothetical protein [Chitinophaga sp. RAB17]|uniref:hypothetical protein n=1 Tax=Chitinophaga sp. RAB17 TaxID=3233049 RepID=UPI003F93B8D7